MDPDALTLAAVSCTFVSKDDPGQRYTAVSDVSLSVKPVASGETFTFNLGGVMVPDANQAGFANAQTLVTGIELITGLTVNHVGFQLSREQRTKVEAEAQAMAIERFKAKAGDIAKGFGFGGYTLREVSVNANDQRKL